jgi:hypothetical protein
VVKGFIPAFRFRIAVQAICRGWLAEQTSWSVPPVTAGAAANEAGADTRPKARTPSTAVAACSFLSRLSAGDFTR